MTVINETLDEENYYKMEFVEFVEFLARYAFLKCQNQL